MPTAENIQTAWERYVKANEARELCSKEYGEALKDVISLVGLGVYWQDAKSGVVYKTDEKKGTFVDFFPAHIVHTKRETDTKGTLSMKEAQEKGFKV